MEMSFTDEEGRGGRGGVTFANVTIRREWVPGGVSKAFSHFRERLQELIVDSFLDKDTRASKADLT